MHRFLTLPILLLLTAAGVRAGEDLQAADLAAGLTLVDEAGAWQVRRSGAAPRPIDPGVGFRPSAVSPLGDGWLVVGTVTSGRRSDLLLLRGGTDGVEVLPAPGGRADDGPIASRGGPVALVADDRLLGVAWLEADRQDDLVVRSAEWLDGDWGPIEEVSPQGPGALARGAQLGLAAAVLPGGDWLLLWAGVDGEDDEILWSRRGERTWTAPRRLHGDNRVPDIKPTVVATPDGALAAWSVFHDGHYRLRLGRLHGATWSLGPPSGGLGALYPEALVADDGLLILHRSVVPDGWAVLELDRDGAPLREGFVGRATSARPVVVRTDDGGYLLRWPGEAGAGHAPTWDPAR